MADKTDDTKATGAPDANATNDTTADTGTTTKAKAGNTVPLRLLRDAWDADGNRVAADGEITQWPVDQAKALIDAGVAERADPLPGEK